MVQCSNSPLYSQFPGYTLPMEVRLMMKRIRTFSMTLFTLLFVGVMRAQTAEVLPEVDGYSKVNPSWRVFVQAKDTKEDAKPGQAEVGPSVQYYQNSLLRSKRDKNDHLDDSKSTVLVLDAGYR